MQDLLLPDELLPASETENRKTVPLADRLRQLQKARGMTAIQVAEAAKCSSYEYNLYCRGKRYPGFKRLLLLAKAFGLRLHELLKDVG